MNSPSLLAAFALLAPLLSAQTSALREVTEERIAAAFVDASAALGEELKVEIDRKFTPRIVSSKDVAARVTEENVPIVRLRQPDADLAKAEAEQLGVAFAQGALAKYTWTTKELLVSAKTWRRQALMTGRPELTSDETLRVVLVHELVHALDDAQFDIGARYQALKSVDACMGFNAVFEGHAQLLARRVAERRGWTKGFDVLAEYLGGLPVGAESMELVQLDMLRVQVAVASAPYVAGERFVAALEKHGPETIARAFHSPPESIDDVDHPEWYLDPKTRSEPKHALAAAIDAFALPYPDADWMSRRMTPCAGQVEAPFAALSPESTRNALGGRITSRSIVLQPRLDPNSKLLSATVHEFVDEAALKRYVAAGIELARVRDEDMRKPDRNVRLRELVSKSIDAVDQHARIERRSLANGGLEFVSTQAVVARGSVLLELVFSNEAVEDDALLALADRMLDAAAKSAPKPR